MACDVQEPEDRPVGHRAMPQPARRLGLHSSHRPLLPSPAPTSDPRPSSPQLCHIGGGGAERRSSPARALQVGFVLAAASDGGTSEGGGGSNHRPTALASAPTPAPTPAPHLKPSRPQAASEGLELKRCPIESNSTGYRLVFLRSDHPQGRPYSARGWKPASGWKPNSYLTSKPDAPIKREHEPAQEGLMQLGMGLAGASADAKEAGATIAIPASPTAYHKPKCGRRAWKDIRASVST